MEEDGNRVLVRRPSENYSWEPRSSSIEFETEETSNSKALKVEFSGPAKYWTDAIPIGNGRLGAMVWGGVASETLNLNEDTLWTGIPGNYTNPDVPEALSKVRKLVDNGQYAEATIEGENLLGGLCEVYQLLGDVKLEFDASHAAYNEETYQRELDLDTATAKVKYSVGEVEFTREHFASNPDQVIVTKISGNKSGSVSFVVSLDSQLHHHSYVNGKNQIIMEGSCPGKRIPPKKVNENDNPKGIQFSAVLELQISNGVGTILVLDDKKLKVEGSDWAVLLLVASSSFDGPFTKPIDSKKDPTSESLATLKAIRNLSYSDLSARHLDDYQNLFHRVSLQLSKSSKNVGEDESIEMKKLLSCATDVCLEGSDNKTVSTAERVKSFQADEDPSLVELLFQFGRYLLISCSRPGTQVANLQGIWNKDIEPAWECAPHLNINLEMNYWPSLPCNLHECQEPLFDHISFLSINGTKTAQICKDKDEAEVWFIGLKALTSHGRQRKWRTESRSDGIPSEANSPRTYTQRSSPLNSPFGSGDSLQKDGGDQLRLHSPYESPPKNGLDKAFSDVILYAVPPKGFFPSDSASGSVHSLSSGGSDSVHGHMKGMGMDAFRVSSSSAVSSSSQGSGHDDGDALGDVFIWGEGIGDGVLGGGPHRVGNCFGAKMDSLLPKALDSAVVLDVQNMACGGRHAALVTKQGEIFSWGEESGGRLGHGVESDVLLPKLIDALSHTNIELVACGEYHTCAVTLSGDLYTWGDGHFGILGHGNEVSHWVPKRVNGPLEGIHVSSISCGPWHTAVVTSAGQLFTFGDGTFGVLGHGDRRSVLKPREVESLKGLRTVRAACGVWHTAAVVEVMVGNSSSSNCSSGKLFTWGDGDKGRLGHGDKQTKLVPTCVAALVEPNFCRVACGHSLTIALTTSGHVYTMGSPVYGQLGNPQADGKLPARVEGKLKSFVEEIACGAYHVAVLTSRTEVYTWGKGANGRLGHGDTDDRNCPSLVEALKDKQVKSIACGTNFTAAICLHKWVSGVDQSMCSGCRLPFNFKRKRHNCYNCGLLFCNSCSSKKSLKASMAPNPNKPYRVCDNCFGKLKKTIETDASSQSSVSRRGSMNQGINELIEKDDKLDSRPRSHLARFSSMESFKQGESHSSKRNKKLEFSSSRVSPIPNGSSQWGALNISKSFNPVFGSSKKFFSASVPGSRIVSRATSPISRRPSPPRSTTPTPTLGGLTSPKIGVDDAKRTNESLNEEVIRLRKQVENLTRKAQHQEVELERTSKQLKEAIREETAKCKAAKEVIKSLTSQLKEMAERLPVGAARNINLPCFTAFSANIVSNEVSNASVDRLNGQITFQEPDSNGSNGQLLSNGSSISSNRSSGQNRQAQSETTMRNGSRTKEGDSRNDNEWVEQDESGVYITLTSLPGGVKDLKRVRFSRKRFSEKEAEQWWAENRARVYERYNVRTVDKSSVGVGSEDLAH